MNAFQNLILRALIALFSCFQLTQAAAGVYGLSTCSTFYDQFFKHPYTSQINLNRLSTEPEAKVIYTGGESNKEVTESLKNIDWLQWRGQNVIVDLNPSDPLYQYSAPHIMQIPQTVLSLEMLSSTTQSLVTQVLKKSAQHHHAIEAGAVQFIFKDGSQKTSELFTGDEHFVDFGPELNRLISGIDWNSVAEISFYHTHPTKTPMPLSLTDKFVLFDRMESLIPMEIPVHFFAIPAHQNGRIIFSQTRLSDESKDRIKESEIQFQSRRIVSRKSNLSAQEVFGSGKKTIFGISKGGEIYFVHNDKRYEFSGKYKADLKIENSDKLDEGEFFILNIPTEDPLSENQISNARNLFQRILNPYQSFFSELKRLTGASLPIPAFQSLRLNSKYLRELILKTGFKDSNGRIILAERWQLTNGVSDGHSKP